MQNQVLKLNYYIMIWVVKGLILLISRFNIVSPIYRLFDKGLSCKREAFWNTCTSSNIYGSLPQVTENREQKNQPTFFQNMGDVPAFSGLINNSQTRPISECLLNFHFHTMPSSLSRLGRYTCLTGSKNLAWYE